MPAERTFSYEYLRTLVRDHPDWTNHEYAAELTREARERLGDPGYPMVRPNTVAAALSRYRPTWEEQGIPRVRRNTNLRLLPWAGIPEAHSMATPLRRLRVLERLAAGDKDVDPRAASMARSFERRLREGKRVVDLTPGGRPVVRAARPDEIDGTGELISLYAKWPGITESNWSLMTAEQREESSARWLADRKVQHG